MKVTEIKKGRHYVIRRVNSRERWPEDWTKACGLADGVYVAGLQFHDGDFIADTVDVLFGTTSAPPPLKLEMLQKWANKLPERQAILKFWEWLDKESHYMHAALLGYDIEKLLDRHHGIDRKQLDAERQALLDQQMTKYDAATIATETNAP